MVCLPTFTIKDQPNVGKYIYHTWMVWVCIIAPLNGSSQAQRFYAPRIVSNFRLLVGEEAAMKCH